MDHSKEVTIRTCRVCRVCPGNCMWNVHVSNPFSWKFIQDTRNTSTETIRQKYEIKLNRKLTVKQLIQEVNCEIEANETAVLNRDSLPQLSAWSVWMRLHIVMDRLLHYSASIRKLFMRKRTEWKRKSRISKEFAYCVLCIHWIQCKNFEPWIFNIFEKPFPIYTVLLLVTWIFYLHILSCTVFCRWHVKTSQLCKCLHGARFARASGWCWSTLAVGKWLTQRPVHFQPVKVLHRQWQRTAGYNFVRIQFVAFEPFK